MSASRKSFLGCIKQKLRRSSNKTNNMVPAVNVTPASNKGSDNAPPPYSAVARPASLAPSRASQMSSQYLQSLASPDDPYAFLFEFDTVFLIDDSSSMIGQRWDQVACILKQITPICTSHDVDGIDVYFLNRKNPSGGRAGGFLNIKQVAQVQQLFAAQSPSGATPTGRRIRDILKPYVEDYASRLKRNGGDVDSTGLKPVNLIVITDGEPSDDVESNLCDIAKRLDKLEAPSHQVGIQFFQVGNDRAATKHLQELDDELSEMRGVRDMVDTVKGTDSQGRVITLDADKLLKAVLGAVVRRLDRKKSVDAPR